MSSWINYNGNIISSDTSKLNFRQTAITSGETIVESIRLQQGDFLFAERHYFHLMAQMRMARMPIPLAYTPEYFYDALLILRDKVDYENGTFDFYVTLVDSTPIYWVSAKNLKTEAIFFPHSIEIELYKESHVDNSFLNRINFVRPQNRILTTYAEENHIQDLILLNSDKSTARSIFGNIYMVKDETLYTPAFENGALDDVWRDRILTACKRMPHFEHIQEGELFPFKLTKADEIFIVHNGKGIISVNKFRKTQYDSTIASAIPEYLLELG